MSSGESGEWSTIWGVGKENKEKARGEDDSRLAQEKQAIEMESLGAVERDKTDGRKRKGRDGRWDERRTVVDEALWMRVEEGTALLRLLPSLVGDGVGGFEWACARSNGQSTGLAIFRRPQQDPACLPARSHPAPAGESHRVGLRSHHLHPSRNRIAASPVTHHLRWLFRH